MKEMVIKLSDGTEYALNVDIIIQNRANFYVNDFNGDIKKSYADSISLFQKDVSAILEWAVEEMNWEDVEKHAVKIKTATPLDMQDEWINCEYYIREKEQKKE